MLRRNFRRSKGSIKRMSMEPENNETRVAEELTEQVETAAAETEAAEAQAAPAPKKRKADVPAILMIVIGIAILGFGIALSVVANVILNSGEAFVKAVSDTLQLDFGNVKVVFDVSCVLIALVLSLLLFDFSVVGIREGTVISALLAGVVVKRVSKVVRAPLERVLSDSPQKA